MKTYARIVSGLVVEVFPPAYQLEDVFIPGVSAVPPSPANPNGTPEVLPVLIHSKGDEIPIADRFHPDFVAELIPVPEGVEVAPGDSFDGITFGPPPAPPVPPAPTAADVRAMRDALLAEATLRIDPLSDAVELDEATPAEIAALKAWRQYRVALNRIEQQAGFPAAVDWPKAPS
ncbi:tail fiber assembly protein [Variovorax sp. AB1(2024)]|uniref:tail fiber assembly protein n=1 Tax=Variovorax sp. AB1(2024) TaxID=3132214 RepID=UPI0030ABA170